MGKDSVERRNFYYYILSDIVKLQGLTHLCVRWKKKKEKNPESLGVWVVGTTKIWDGILASGEHEGDSSLTPPQKVERRENI